MSAEVELTPIEERIVGLCRSINGKPLAKELQTKFLRHLGVAWTWFLTGNLVRHRGLERVLTLEPEGGVLLCANHRSFFDLYLISMVLFREDVAWAQRLNFPVRSNFFYDSWRGLAINLILGGGSLYPPVFRDRAKAKLNRASVDEMIEILRRPGSVVGIHPEGTRGKGPDPYELLRAQPGVGQLALASKAPVVPVFINGLCNDFYTQVSSNFRSGEHKGAPITMVFGDPVDLSEFTAERPRATVYKRASDHILSKIAEVGEEERVFRTEVLSDWTTQ